MACEWSRVQHDVTLSLLRPVAAVILFAALLGGAAVQAASLEGSLTVSGVVGAGTGSPAASAQLEVSSTTKGLLPPRMTAEQRTAIDTPAAGLMVYQTDAPVGLYSYNGTEWVQVGATVSADTILPTQTGNSGKFLTTNGSAVNWGTTTAGTVTGVSGTAPISVTNGTTTPAVALTGTVPVANGGTGAATLTGYVKGSGTSALTAAATIPGADVAGNIGGNAANVTGTIAVASGGTGAITAAAAVSALLPAQTGNDGKVLTTDGSAVSWGTVSGGGGGSSTVTATASGALIAGQLVAFNSTGQAKSIVTTNSGTSDAISSFTVNALSGVAGSTQPTYIVSTFVGNDKVVVAYNQADGTYVMAGTLAGTTVTWGQPLRMTTHLYPYSICMLEVDRFAVAYAPAAGQTAGYLMVGKLTGTTITMGVPGGLVQGANTYNFQCVGLGNNYLVASGAWGFPEYWKYDSTTLALTNQGYSAMVGAQVSYSITPYDAGKCLYATTHGSDLTYSWPLQAATGSYASNIPPNQSAALYVRVIKTSATNNPSVMLYVYWNHTGSAQYARTATITTGNFIAWQSAPVELPTPFYSDNMTLVNTADHMAVMMGSTDGVNLQALSINTASGTPVLGTMTPLLTSGNARNIVAYGGNGGGRNGRFVTAYCDTTDSSKPKVIVGQMGNSSTVDRASATGIVVSGAAAGGTATIALLGSTASAYTNLTPGAIYYIQGDGSIGTTVTPYPAGVAISSTTLQMYSTGAISNSSITVTQDAGNQIKSNSGNSGVYTEFTTGDESVRVYANGKSSFYADGHTDSSLNIDRGTIFTAIAINNLASGGAIGTAAATVDMGSMFNLNQTTAGQTITLPTPTNGKAGRVAYLANTGSVAFTAYGASGNVAAGATRALVWTGAAWTGLSEGSGGTPSDRRLKENITPTRFGLAELMKLQAVDYNFIADAAKAVQTGFIAQDVNAVFPDAVTVGGDDPGTRPWSVNYGRVTPLLVSAIQELKAENDVLRADNDALRTDNDALKAQQAAMQTQQAAMQTQQAEILKRLAALEGK